MWQKGNFPTLLGGRKICTATIENNKGFLENDKNRIITGSSNPTAGNTPGQNCKSKRYVYPYSHSSTVHNSQNIEMT